MRLALLVMGFFISTISFAKDISLPWSEAVTACDSAIRWGYFRQRSYKGSEMVDLWSSKDLYGKYKTEAECKSESKKYKKGWAEECQMFSIGEDNIQAEFFFAKASESLNLNRGIKEIVILFKDKKDCDLAVKNGGLFKTKDGEKKISAKGSDSRISFATDCDDDKIFLCEKNRTTADVSNFN